MGGCPITNEVGEKALRKLEAVDVTKGARPHPEFAIYHDGRVVCFTSLRHSSKKDIPLPYLKRDLRVSAHFVLDLARCPKSRLDWLKAIGEVSDTPPTSTGEPSPVE